MELSIMKSALVKRDANARDCFAPVPITTVELVIPFANVTTGADVGALMGAPTAVVSAWGKQPIVTAVLQTANGSAAFAIESMLLQSSSVKEGVTLQACKGCSLVSDWPPTAFPSRPLLASLKMSCIPCNVTFLSRRWFVSNENFSEKPSGFKSGSNM